jgi:tetratricopeptide (TPR) repeat protein
LESVVSSSSVGRSWTRTRASSSSPWASNRTQQINQTVINQNFYHSMNYAYRPSAWGHRPWWHRNQYRPHNYSVWSFHWSSSARPRYYYRHQPYAYHLPGYTTYHRRAYVPWGLVSWSLGSLIYDTGYYHYYNPYSVYAPPVVSSTRTIVYDRPLAVQSAEFIETELPPNAEELSSAAFERASEAFLADDFPMALKLIDEAIAHTPDDPMLHEFRALALFALGSYGDAAGVMHSLLATGPGWNADTMLGFYSSPETYYGQLERLDQYASGTPDAGGAHFLLGYHHVVGGRLEEASAAFARAVEIESEDSLAAQLHRLVENSLVEEAEIAAGTTPVPEVDLPRPVPATQLTGSWHTVSAGNQAIVLTLTSESSFTWSYGGANENQVLSGTWSLDEDGLLVLADEDVQMVASIEMESEHALRFTLVGGPEGDSGLLFERR